jgi:uncharacterized protein YifN (PemK superfamily)
MSVFEALYKHYSCTTFYLTVVPKGLVKSVEVIANTENNNYCFLLVPIRKKGSRL